MSSFLDIIAKVTKISIHYDDDFFDRMSHRYTLGVLLISTIIIGTKQYVGDPIDCWTPAHFSSQHVKYADNICWISNTYYVGHNDKIEDIPSFIGTRRDRELSYYQWFPYILLSMAFLFYLPHVVWRLYNSRVGLDVSGVVATITTSEHLNPENREKTMNYLVRHMDRYFTAHHEYRPSFCRRLQVFLAERMCFCGKRVGNQMLFVYLLVKLLYIANSIAQLFLLNAFLRQDFAYYGTEVISKIANGSDWRESRRFPRVTLCDFEIRRLGGLHNIHRYTLQCALPINLFSEKIFIFIWFWLVLVAALSCWGLLPWIATAFQKTRRHYIKKYLKMANQLNTQADKKLANTFVDTYLRQDGLFVLRLVSKNANDLVITDVVLGLWEHFKKFRRDYHPSKLSAEAV